MNQDLFSSFRDQKLAQKEVEKDQYEELVEQRNRPDVPEGFTQTIENDDPVIDKTYALKSVSEITPRKPIDRKIVLEESKKYFNGDELAANVWMNKYALKDSEGNIYEKTPDDMHHRLAKEIARIEKKYKNPFSEEKIYGLLKDFKYIVPQGSPMAGIGNNFQIASLSNCFVIGNNGNSDSYGGIMKVDQEQVQLMKRRGGVGHDLSHIRPAGSEVKNSALTSTGIVPFMERYSNSTREVAQDGRRGALMLSVSVKHPDAEKFIDAKLEEGKVTGANISVKITDEFMRSVKENKSYKQQYPIDSENPKVVKKTDAGKIWKKIIHNAWASAEPGVLFWDTIINESVADAYADLGFKTVSTNPCGEIPLCPYDSCRLLALNLYSYVDNPFTPEASFNSQLFTTHVHAAQRIMDDIIDLELEKIDGILDKINADPEDEFIKATEKNLWLNIRNKALQGRRTGIGITAEGDMLAALGFTYGTKEATKFSVEVHKHIAIESYSSSVNLAEERGPFPIFNKNRELDNPFIKRLGEHAPKVLERMKRVGRRNISLLTIAPTGSVSICTQTSSGIEPVFQVSYKRRRKVNPNDRDVKISFVDTVGDSWEEYLVFHPKFVTWLEVNGYNVDEVKGMSDKNLQNIIKESPYYKATANDIDWVEKVRMQGAVQKWVDHSISVTVNLPEDVSEEMVSDVYTTAWESGCKGMTIYRDGSRSGVLVSNDENQKSHFTETTAPRRSKELESVIIRFQNDYEKWIAFIGLMDGKPYEIFTGKAEDFLIPKYLEKGWVIKHRDTQGVSQYDFEYIDRDGYRQSIRGLSRSFNKEYWNYAKLISGILRHGMPLPYVVNLVEKLDFEIESINTWKNGVIRAIKKFVPDGTKVEKSICPQCNEEGTLIYKEGCLTCSSCGYSKCG